MGLFSKKETCSLCGAPDAKQKLIDGYICKACQEKSEVSIFLKWKDTTLEEAQKYRERGLENERRKFRFSPDKKVEKFILIDSVNQLWQIPDLPTYFSFSDLLDYEVLVDGETIITGGLGRAVVGGLLFGETGAIVGGITGPKKTKEVITSLIVKCTINHHVYPQMSIDILRGVNAKVGSLTYNLAQNNLQKLLAELELMKQAVGNTGVATPIQSTSSNADEIVKYKNLLDQGIITQQEFDAKKKQLLGL